MAGGVGILGGYGLRYKVTATRIADWEEYVHRLANQSLQMDSSGNVDITGVINIGTSGGIYQGTGTFASPTTGLKIYNSGGIGLIAGYNGGTVQWYADTDGKLYAGAGAVRLDNNGISLTEGIATVNKVRWVNGANTLANFSSYGTDGIGVNLLLTLSGISSAQDAAFFSLTSTPFSASGGGTQKIILDTTAGITAQLGDNAGSNKFRFHDSGDVLVGSVDSDGSAIFKGGLNIGSATGATAGQIKTSDDIIIADGKNLEWSDVNLYRSAANLLQTGDSLTVDLGLNVGSATGAGTGQIRASDTINAANGFVAPLSPGSARWGIDANSTGTSVTDTATYQPFGNTNAFSGLFIVNALDSGSVGLFMQGGNTVVLISESVANTFSVTQGTASRVNVYLATNVVTIENRRGVTVEIRTFAIRTRNFY